ncbi:MAG: PhnD/SsuA/transferrin family substrate-binding protein [Pseudomonadota bacterium]
MEFQKLSPLMLVHVAFVALAIQSAPKQVVAKTLRMTGLPVLETAALLHAVEQPIAKQFASSTTFVPWTNPDQLKALLVSGKVDVAIIPSNVAVALYNKKLPFKLLLVTEASGLLSIVSRGRAAQNMASLKGSTIAVPFRHSMPDLILTRTLQAVGIDSSQDIDIRYAGTPVAAAQLLLLGRVDHAFLAEPFTTITLMRSKVDPGANAAKLFRSIAVDRTWSQTVTPGRGPLVGAVIVSTELAQDTHRVSRLARTFSRSFRAVKNAPETGAQLLAANFPKLKPRIVAMSLQRIQSTVWPAAAKKKEFMAFLNELVAIYPQAIGGQLPHSELFVKIE